MGSEWQRLLDELDQWHDTGHVAEFWWRDDDAIDDSPSLQRLLDLSDRREIPILLAVIPNSARSALADVISRTEYVDIAQHGCNHENNAAVGEKKVELGGRQSDSEILEALKTAQSSLRDLFSGQVTDILVPPWNRIRETLIPHLPELGFFRLSRYRSKSEADVPNVSLIDTEIDIIDWRGSRGFLGEGEVISQMTNRLIERRDRRLSGPMGILTHHLVHDDACWAFMERLGSVLGEHPAAIWLRVPQR